MNIGAKKTPQPFSRKSSKGALLSRQNKRTPAPIDQDLLPASSRQSSALMQQRPNYIRKAQKKTSISRTAAKGTTVTQG